MNSTEALPLEEVRLIWDAIADIPDPEIPAINLAEMGILRSVNLRGEAVVVTITPTFSGCPAISAIKEAIRDRLNAAGFPQVVVEEQSAPPWSSDWISETGREKFRRFGVTPPARHAGNVDLFLLDPIPCPRCGSQATRIQNAWGSTPCRMIFTCLTCQEPFESFKLV